MLLKQSIYPAVNNCGRSHSELFQIARKLVTTVLFVLLSGWSLISFATETLNIENDHKTFSLLIPYLEFIEDPTAQLSLEEVTSEAFNKQFKPAQLDSSTFFKSHPGVYWFRYSIKNNGDHTRRFWLDLNNINLDNISFYSPSSSGYNAQTSREQIKQKPWYLYKVLSTYKMDIHNQQEKLFYFRIDSSSNPSRLIFTPRVYTDHAIIAHISNLSSLSGLVYGVILALFLYSLNIYFSLKDKTFLYFLYLLIAVTFEITCLQGAINLVFDEKGSLTDLSTTIAYIIFIVTNVLFTCRFLLLEKFNPTLNKVVLTIGFLAIPVSIITYISSPANINYTTLILSALSSLSILVASFKRFNGGYKPAIFILISTLIAFSPIPLMSMLNLSASPILSYTNILSITLVFQVIALASGLVSRIDTINKQLSHEVTNRKRREARLLHAQTIARYGDWHWYLSTQTPQLSTSAVNILPDCIDRNKNIFIEVYRRIVPEDQIALRDAINKAKIKRQGFEQEFRMVGYDEQVHYFLIKSDYQRQNDHKKDFMIGTLHDISESKQHEHQLRQLGYYDSLTGLANRMLFNERLQHAINKSQRSTQNHALLFIDLDQFKNINDSLGHEVGDKLLIKVAERLLEHTRVVDTVARLGGDEFAILIEDIPAPHAAATVAEHIIKSMAKTVEIDSYKLVITPSIGIAMYPDNDRNIVDLMRKADTAMYYAKTQGRNNYQFYTDQLNEKIIRKMELEAELRFALPHNELTVNFQPKIDLKTGSVTGAEALLRWNSAKFGSVSPFEFIGLAEETGLIWPIGEFVLEESCKQAKIWLEKYPSFGNIAVNISGVQFNDASLIKMVKNTLEKTGLPAHHLELEITENAIIDNAEEAYKIMLALKELGVKLSLDDFGTGYSSLKYLKRFPVDSLKIDRSFVAEIVSDPTDRRIASSIIKLAHELNLNVVAEGVETIEQLVLIEQMGCDELQGYIFSPAVSAEEMSDMLENDDNLAYHVPEIDRYDQLELLA